MEGQINLFDFGQEDVIKEDILPDIEEYPPKVFTNGKEVLGMYLTGHPLDEYEEELKKTQMLQVSILLIMNQREAFPS